MRQHAIYAAVLVITTGVVTGAQAGPWSEYGVADPLRSAQQLVEASCDLSVELRGAIVDVSVRQRVTNPGPASYASVTEFSLPEGAQLIGMTLQRGGKGRAEAALPVTAWTTAETVASPAVLGSDPAIVMALQPGDDGRQRYRVVVQPIDQDGEFTLETRWTATASIHDGSLQVLLPGRGDGAPRCRGLASVQTGPGASVERLRLDSTDLGARSTAAFELGAIDATLSAVLAFKRAQPVMWTQTQPPLPNPDYNTDDRTIVNYPLTFSVREQKPFVVAGDADSSSPIDIDAVKGGVPASAKRGPIKAGDTSTPLGGLRPTPTK